ncbi:AI-2E family transporter [Corynebacterium provencense]|jgi:predicted PurR-regulated permease PerM|uniref:AI-2 transport protein TqsA n=1 Tax=Corynebacterium provencense TaxID=1737425 RepID=A0A2Z3YUR0_9CORY|nr:AI-2E family transporter [Corynebacterium provencense]AWT25777.1 AI-2 transport protein TqsA [Corynebacterium provencense]MCI1257432.1 AI-2E family transporter [Corynebacterium provencense]
MVRVSSEQSDNPNSDGDRTPDRRSPRDTPQGRDFADFLMGSAPLPTESAAPLPGEQESLLEQPADTDGVPDTRILPDIPEVTTEDADGNGIPDNEEEIRDRAEVIGTSMRWFSGWCLRFLVIAAAATVLWIGSAKLWAGILPIILSIIVCTVLWPVVNTLRRWRFPNALAVLTSLLVFFSVIAGVIAAIAPSVVDQTGELVDKGTEGVEKIQNWVAGPPLNLQNDQIDNAIDQATSWLQNRTDQITQTAVAGVSAVTSAVVTLVVVLVLTFFFLKDGEKFLPMVRRVTGRRVGWHITEALTRCWNTLGGFIRTQALVSFIDAFFIGLGLLILGVPLAGPLAIITFFGGFIPIVGAFSAGALSVLVALVGKDFTTALIVLLIVIAVQQLEGNVLSPLLQSRAMNLHPVVVLLSVTVGGGLWGIIGAFLAVPVAAMIAEILRYIGDLTDLSTGEKTAEEIHFATESGEKGAERNVDAARRWREWRDSRKKVSAGRPGQGSETDTGAENDTEDAPR